MEILVLFPVVVTKTWINTAKRKRALFWLASFRKHLIIIWNTRQQGLESSY